MDEVTRLFLRLAEARGVPPHEIPWDAETSAVPMSTSTPAAGLDPLSAERLGQLYERLVSRVGEGGETRKAVGLFYTPRWVARALVVGTLGPRLEGRTVEEVAGLRVLDPTCGCGAFLLEAYRYLLEWYREATSTPRLSMAERVRILTTHLRGVDLDEDAVEVCRKSLLVVLLDDARGAEGRARHLRDARDALESHVVCADFLGGETWGPDRFDIVVGNPPYVRRQALARALPAKLAEWRRRYRAASSGNWDHYVVFVERSLELLAPAGRLGFVLPHRWLTLDYGAGLRSLLAEGRHVERIVHFGDHQLFGGATTYTCLLHATRAPTAAVRWARVDDLDAYREDGAAEEGVVGWARLGSGPWNPRVGVEARLLEALVAAGPPLESVCERIYQGLATSADAVYVLEVVEERGTDVVAWSKALGQQVVLESRWLRPMLFGCDIGRYEAPRPTAVVLFPYRGPRAAPVGWSVLLEETPRTAAYLLANEARLRARSKVTADWWLFPYPKNLARFARPKIVSQVLAPRATFGLDLAGGVCFAGGGTAGGNGVAVTGDDPTELHFLLGLLNSPVTTFWVRTGHGSAFRSGHHAYGRASLKSLPVPRVHGPAAEALRVGIADTAARAVARRTLARHAPDAATRGAAGRRADALEREVDHHVMELYGLDTAQRAWLARRVPPPG